MKSNVMHIYAQGTSLFAQRNLYDNKVEVALQKYWYDIIYCNMGIQIHNKIREIYYQNSKKKKVKFVKLNFPTRVISNTVEEEVRRLCSIVPDAIPRTESGWMKEIFEKVAGFTREEYEAYKQYISNSWDRITLNDFFVDVKKYGNGARKIYVLGPCIVYGANVTSEKETFMYCLYQELMKSQISCEVIGIVVGLGKCSCYESMKQMLPYYGMELVEIERVKLEEQPISATKLRKYLKEGNWKQAEKLMPEKAVAYVKAR